jgi:hypothetical protein
MPPFNNLSRLQPATRPPATYIPELHPGSILKYCYDAEQKDACETTQTQAIQSCICGKGRGPGKDRHASAHPSRTFHQETQDETT